MRDDPLSFFSLLKARAVVAQESKIQILNAGDADIRCSMCRDMGGGGTRWDDLVGGLESVETAVVVVPFHL